MNNKKNDITQQINVVIVQEQSSKWHNTKN